MARTRPDGLSPEGVAAPSRSYGSSPPSNSKVRSKISFCLPSGNSQAGTISRNAWVEALFLPRFACNKTGYGNISDPELCTRHRRTYGLYHYDVVEVAGLSRYFSGKKWIHTILLGKEKASIRIAGVPRRATERPPPRSLRLLREVFWRVVPTFVTSLLRLGMRKFFVTSTNIWESSSPRLNSGESSSLPHTIPFFLTTIHFAVPDSQSRARPLWTTTFLDDARCSGSDG
ncbi:hypothetical protein B0H11DRAFT_1932010 [Mycena galericulata]|nr:hypothetical protein B0H11DRAFT_1932010 [Mycena galericulata]